MGAWDGGVFGRRVLEWLLFYFFLQSIVRGANIEVRSKGKGQKDGT